MPSSTDRKAPPFPLRKIFKDRDNLYALLHPFVGKVPEKETFERLCQALGAAYLISPRSQAVFETVRTLPPVPLTAKVLWMFSWRVAANASKLRKNEPIRPWAAQLEDEWVAFEVLSIRFDRHEAFGPPYIVELRALSGSCAGLTMTQMWAASAILEHAQARVFDVYRGQGVAEGSKSVAVEILLQPREKTLTDAEIEALSAKVVAAAEKAVSAKLRA